MAIWLPLGGSKDGQMKTKGQMWDCRISALASLKQWIAFWKNQLTSWSKLIRFKNLSLNTLKDNEKESLWIPDQYQWELCQPHCPWTFGRIWNLHFDIVETPSKNEGLLKVKRFGLHLEINVDGNLVTPGESIDEQVNDFQEQQDWKCFSASRWRGRMTWEVKVTFSNKRNILHDSASFCMILHVSASFYKFLRVTASFCKFLQVFASLCKFLQVYARF